MARLTQHLPAEPVPFLIKILNKFDEKAKKPVSTSVQFIGFIHVGCIQII